MSNDKQKNILLVEDEAITGIKESREMEKFGYNVVHVLDGQQAIDTIYNNEPVIDLILMDINLGEGMDGTEAAKIILKERDIPIIFLSNHSEPEIIDKTNSITSYGYVLKNTGITVLDASIKMAFRLHEAGRKLSIQQDKIETQKNELEFSEKRYRRLFESAKDGILILNASSGMIVDVNPFLIEMLGYSQEQFLNKNIWSISPFKNLEYSKELFKELQDKEYVRYSDLPLETSDGNQVHVEFVSNVYLVDAEKVIQCNIRDITDRKRYEKLLTNNIDKKDALLQELQHRTKNSFSMITSLISLRNDATESVETKRVLEELSIRIKSISDLYSLLYETKSFNDVDLKFYLNKVIESMLNLSKNIVINKSIEEITVSSKYASSIGMILIELLSNAIKYAFTETQKGTINIELKKINSTILLKIEDDGVGLQPDFDKTKISSIGLHLVNLMVNQLNGTIEFHSENGTKIHIECPMRK